MKLALLGVCVGAFLAVPGIAAAATPQGTLTGTATILGTPVAIGIPVTDGGISYVGAGNDLSGNCDGDGGTIIIGGTLVSILCTHFVASSGCCSAGSPKMRFAYQVGPSNYAVIRITDNGGSPDTFAIGNTTSLADAQSWVNMGRSGGGFAATPWTFDSLTSGDYTVTP